jgi:hypothetical protein
MGKEDEIKFALGVLDDHRRLIAAGKALRWDIVKWAVTVNIALAAASVALKQQDTNVKGLFCLLALVVIILSVSLMWEITRRMTATRNDSLVPARYLIKQNIDVVSVTEEQLPREYTWYYDIEELGIYVAILLVSAFPALGLWLVG